MESSQPWQSWHTVYTNAKAGMEGVDKEKVQKVVYEMSKGSRHFENEKRKEEALRQRIENMRFRAAHLTAAELTNFKKIADKRLVELESHRDLSRIWMHVDLDAFYAAVETLEDPSLGEKPMAVGGMSMICTANYKARKFGVRAAMPGFIACKLCPELIFVPPNFEKYGQYSERVRQVFREYDSHFLARGLDEAYLDITNLCSQRSMTAGEIAEELRSRVYKETGLTCSAGVGPNRLIAKVCSDIEKPNGQYVLPNELDAVKAFLSTLPIRKVSGIGKVMENLLREVLGINTCEDLLKSRALIVALFSNATSDFMLSVGLGVGGSDTPEEEPRKSLSSERTFPATSNEDELVGILVELAEGLSKELKEEGLHGRTLTLKLKTIDFEVQTRSRSFSSPIQSKDEILHHATKLLKAELPISLRLIGLRMSQFESKDPTQKSLFRFILMGSDDPCGVLQSDNMCHPLSDDRDLNKNSLQSKGLLKSPENTVATLHTVQTVQTVQSLSPSVPFSKGGSSLHNRVSASSSSPDMTCMEILKERSCITATRNSRKGKIDHILGTYVTKKKASGVGEGGFPSDSECMEKREGDFEGSKESDDGLLNVATWREDLSCSICGLELPPCFEVERQEHTDFHLAQLLQQDFSNSYSTLHRASERPSLQQMDAGSRKKGKFVSLDNFFNKV